VDAHVKHDDAGTNQTLGQSFFKAMGHVLTQVEYHCFADLRFKRIDPLCNELCLIIAETFVLRPDSVLKINGNAIDAPVVQEVFFQIRNHHVRLVHDNFYKVSKPVYNKKAYLRTALYNAVFEYESQFVNDMAHC
jgi:hypothetical protein